MAKKNTPESLSAKASEANEDRWQVEEDLRALARAKGVQSDPKRMEKVRALAKEKLSENRRRQEEANELVELGEGKGEEEEE